MSQDDASTAAAPQLLPAGWLDSLYGGYLRMLMAGGAGDGLGALRELLQGHVADGLAGFGKLLSGHGSLASLVQGGGATPLAAAGEALKPLALNVERAYGGLADAFGLAPLRELEQAGREMASAALAHRQAQAAYLDVVAGALGKGAEVLTTRLADMARRGESVDTLLELLRLWARATDEAMHEAMQAPAALKASAELLRAAARSRRQQQRVVAVVSEALNVPTRADMDDAYREIQELKRELRRSRKAAAADDPPPATEARRAAEPGARRTPKGSTAA